jgi:hypothetical protein
MSRALTTKPTAAVPPWAKTADTGALPHPPSELRVGRTPAQITSDNTVAFQALRGMWAKQPAATAGVTAKLPKAFILELLEASGIPQVDWQAGKLCELDNVVRVRQALEAASAATNPETRRAQLERAIYKSRQLAIASEACSLAIQKCINDLGLVDPDGAVALDEPK